MSEENYFDHDDEENDEDEERDERDERITALEKELAEVKNVQPADWRAEMERKTAAMWESAVGSVTPEPAAPGPSDEALAEAIAKAEAAGDYKTTMHLKSVRQWRQAT